MEYTLQIRGSTIIEDCLTSTSKDPIEIFENIASKDYIRMHGPEHHILDGAVILTAFHNAGGEIDLKVALKELMERGLMMPGATCGMWGVCGAVTSIGAALSIIEGTGPLTTDDTWGKHMNYTSKALSKLAEIGGPRCCKRDAFLSMKEAIDYLNENFNVDIPSREIHCEFSKYNEQCLMARCPFWKEYKRKPKVAFICVHNSCRSQIAEALGKHLASDVFESYSAGTEVKPQINQDAVRIMKELYGIDMEQTQFSKLISHIPAPDIAISMGCNVTCPFVGRPFDDDWGLEDPTGKPDEEFKIIIKEIERNILKLKDELI